MKPEELRRYLAQQGRGQMTPPIGDQSTGYLQPELEELAEKTNVPIKPFIRSNDMEGLLRAMHGSDGMGGDATYETIEEAAEAFGVQKPWDDPENANGSRKANYPKAYADMMLRRAGDPKDTFARTYDRMTEGAENEVPGADRAYGKSQEHMHNYMQLRAIEEARRNARAKAMGEHLQK